MATEERSWFLRLLANHPWIGVLSLVANLASIAGLLYAVYWRDHPELTYLIAATRARIVVAGQVTAVRVLYGESPITTDVTAVQVALWNKGRRAVESSDVLQPLRLVTEPRARILEARWQRTTREVCALDVDQSLAAQGELPIRFRILEPHDGGVLQIIYAGPPDVRVRLQGAFKGQHAVAEETPVVLPSFVVWVFYGGFLGLFAVAGAVGILGAIRRKGLIESRVI